MSLTKARELREQRFKLVQDANKLTETTFTPETRAQFDRMMAEADALKPDIDRFERVEALLSEQRGLAPPAGQLGGQITPEERTRKEEEAFKAYLLRGERINDEQRSHLRAQTEYRVDGLLTGGGNALEGTGGGYFVPVGFVPKVESALKYTGPMLLGGEGNPTIMPTATGQPLPYPTDNDTAVQGERIDEGTTVDVASTISISAVIFNAYQYSTRMVKVSRQMMQDSAFDIETFLGEKFGLRLGRILNSELTNGTGIGLSMPYGIVTAATFGATAVGSNVNDGLSGSNAGNSIGTDDLVDLEHSIDPLYRRGAKWMLHDTTLRELKRLKDKYGRPIWLPGLAIQAPDTFLGYPYLVNNFMDQLPISGPNSPITTKKTVLFGQMPKYVVRRVKDLAILRLDERFAEFGQVAFIGFARYDGNLLDAGTHPIKYLANSY